MLSMGITTLKLPARSRSVSGPVVTPATAKARSNGQGARQISARLLSTCILSQSRLPIITLHLPTPIRTRLVPTPASNCPTPPRALLAVASLRMSRTPAFLLRTALFRQLCPLRQREPRKRMLPPPQLLPPPQSAVTLHLVRLLSTPQYSYPS